MRAGADAASARAVVTLARALLAAAVAAAACGPPSAGPAALTPDASALLPSLADPALIYRDLGFFAEGEPLPFVASVHFLAGPTPDSTLAVFGLSLANRALSFRRAPEALEARYRVEVVFRRGPQVVAQLSSDQDVRVGTLEEARRADESVVFQHFFHLPPGALDGSVTVRDRNRLTANRDERVIEVPHLGDGPVLSQLVPIYGGNPRLSRAALPTLLVNPRATSPQGAGADTLRFYLEGYGVAPGAVVHLRAVAADSAEVWSDTLRLSTVAAGRDTVPAAGPALTAAIVSVGPGQLRLGRLQFEAILAGSRDTARTVVLVTFSEQWAVTNLDDVLSLLRFFGHAGELEAIRQAPPPERGARWRAFWRRTDPDTTTPDNEALAAYFRRVEIANLRYAEAGEPGWLTDRGEVYITLGEPDRVDRSDDLRSNGAGIRWTYLFDGETAVLDFVNDLSPQRFRLTFSSRAEYQRLLARVRQGLIASHPLR
jgi:GWxTD domain-containing protein